MQDDQTEDERGDEERPEGNPHGGVASGSVSILLRRVKLPTLDLLGFASAGEYLGWIQAGIWREAEEDKDLGMEEGRRF